MLSIKEKAAKCPLNATPSLLQDSMTASVHDSSGPISLNDSLGPPSLQDDQNEDDPLGDTTDIMNRSFIELDTKVPEPEPLSQYYESTSSLDLTREEDEEPSKIDMSMTASDSGLIGNYCYLIRIISWAKTGSQTYMNLLY